MTDEEKARMAAAEDEALKILNRRISEGRWYPRRHQRLAFIVILGVLVVFLAVVFIARLII